MADDDAPQVLQHQLPAWRVTLLWSLIPCSVSCFSAASVGLYVLTDSERATAIGRSYFAEQWRRLIEWNPFCNALLFNGSLLGLMYCIIQLRKHYEAKRAQALPPADARSRQEKRSEAREQKKLQ